jgi:hypothetical protein
MVWGTEGLGIRYEREARMLRRNQDFILYNVQ